MKKLVCAALVVALLLCVFPLFSSAHAATTAGGILTSDTTWTAAQSPIQLTGSVCVSRGITLTIEPGVTVDLGQYYILVNGTLNAKATSSNNIFFKDTTLSNISSNRKPQIKFAPISTDSILENANFNVVTIVIDGCSPKIRNNVFQNSTTEVINALSGSALIQNNNFVCPTGNGYGVSLGGSTVFDNNVLSSVGYNWAVTCTDNAVVSNNKIISCYGAVQSTGTITIAGNTIMNNKAYGILSYGPANIQGNYIVNDTIGISGSGVIQSNTITGNSIGIQSPNSTITHNNIFGNTQNSLYLTTADTIDATNNWWGTSDVQAIGQTIYDFNDDFDLGTVNFQPILTAASSSAPLGPNVKVPLPSSQPTNSQQPTDTINPTVNQSTPPVDGSLSILTQIETNISGIAKIVLVALGIGWAIVVVAFVTRRIKK